MPRGRLLAWLAGIAFGVTTEAVAWGWDERALWLPDLTVGVALLSCGLTAAWLRPTSGSGSLLTAAGVAWFVPNLSDVDPAMVGQVAGVLLFAHRGPLLHAVLAYPEGRTTSQAVRSVVVVSYLAALGQAFWPNPGLAVAVAVVVLVVALVRYVGALRSRRRARLFALVAAIAWVMVISGIEVARTLSSAAHLDGELLVTYEAGVFLVAVILTVGLRPTWSDRALMTDLVVELGAAATGGLEKELATMLGDPELKVGYWATEEKTYLDVEGHPLDTDVDAEKRSVTPIHRNGVPVAVLVHDETLLSDPAMKDAVGAAVRLVSDNARLRAEVLRQVLEVSASRRRILEAADEQRRRMESRVRHGALHDLEELGTMLDRARATAQGEQSLIRVDAARQQLTRSQEELQQLARGMHPHALAQRGLKAALADLATHSPLPVDVEVEGSAGSVPTILQAAAYFVCSEALANAVKHSSASGATIAILSRPGLLVIEVSDDGVGGAVASRGSGLQGLRDRVEALDGSLVVLSPPDGGTRLVASLPTSAGPPTS